MSEDADTVAALTRAAFASQPVRTDPPPSALLVSGARRGRPSLSGCGAVAEAAGGLAGAALWIEQDGGLYLSRLAVAVAWDGRRIADE